MRNLLAVIILGCFFLSIHGMSSESFESSSCEDAESSSPHSDEDIEIEKIKFKKLLYRLIRSQGSLDIRSEPSDWLDRMEEENN